MFHHVFQHKAILTYKTIHMNTRLQHHTVPLPRYLLIKTFYDFLNTYVRRVLCFCCYFTYIRFIKVLRKSFVPIFPLDIDTYPILQSIRLPNLCAFPFYFSQSQSHNMLWKLTYIYEYGCMK